MPFGLLLLHHTKKQTIKLQFTIQCQRGMYLVCHNIFNNFTVANCSYKCSAMNDITILRLSIVQGQMILSSVVFVGRVVYTSTYSSYSWFSFGDYSSLPDIFCDVFDLLTPDEVYCIKVLNSVSYNILMTDAGLLQIHALWWKRFSQYRYYLLLLFISQSMWYPLAFLYYEC